MKVNVEFLHIIVDKIDFIIAHEPKNIEKILTNQLNLHFHNISFNSASG